MIDIHTHILPGLDDGSRNLDDSLEMAQIAADCGVQSIVCTPHANQMGRFENFRSKELITAYQSFKKEVEKADIPIRLYLGMEIFASDDMYEKIVRKQLFGLNNSRFFLVEFPFDIRPDGIQNYLDMIFAAGKVPVIAHPERYYCVQYSPFLVYDWLQQGCFAQVNKGSLFSKFGESARIAAEVLLDNRLATCVASDAHRPYVRTTYMGDIHDYLEERYGEEEMQRLTVTNPIRLLSDKYPERHGVLPDGLQDRYF